MFLESTLNSIFQFIFGFFREILTKMKNYKEKEENPKKKYRHLKNDLKIYGRVLNNMEKIFKKNSFSPANFENLKEASFDLFLECLTQNLIEIGIIKI